MTVEVIFETCRHLPLHVPCWFVYTSPVENLLICITYHTRVLIVYLLYRTALSSGTGSWTYPSHIQVTYTIQLLYPEFLLFQTHFHQSSREELMTPHRYTDLYIPQLQIAYLLHKASFNLAIYTVHTGIVEDFSHMYTDLKHNSLDCVYLLPRTSSNTSRIFQSTKEVHQIHTDLITTSVYIFYLESLLFWYSTPHKIRGLSYNILHTYHTRLCDDQFVEATHHYEFVLKVVFVIYSLEKKTKNTDFFHISPFYQNYEWYQTRSP